MLFCRKLNIALQDLKKIAGKIAKCLALANSSNPHEAEAAKRQAAALMAKYNLTGDDVAASQVSESAEKTGKNRPPLYLSKLANMIGKAFGCHCIMQTNHAGGAMLFIGMASKPLLASYTFSVLRRQLAKDRAQYLATLGNRYKKASKTRKANLFCEAWLYRISSQVAEFASTEQEETAIKAYKEQRFGGRLKDDNRKSPDIKSGDDHAINAGYQAAKDVLLHKPVQTKNNHLLTY